MARIKDTSVEQVKQAADIVDVVSRRTSLRKQGGRFVGRCPFHDERTPSFSVNPVRQVLLLLWLPAGRRHRPLRAGDGGLDFVGAIEWLAERFHVTLEYEESSPQAEEARRRRDRLYAPLDQAAVFFERHLWEGRRASPCAPISRHGAFATRRSQASSGSACRRGTGLARRRSRRVSPPRSCAPQG